MSRSLLISIKPKYAKKIYSGEKLAELRKSCPDIAIGSMALIYETAPVKAITGVFFIDYIHEHICPKNYVNAAVKRAAVTESEYLDYVVDSKKIVFIDIKEPEMIKKIPLEKLRQIEGFSVPVSYRYIYDDEWEKLNDLIYRARDLNYLKDDHE